MKWSRTAALVAIFAMLLALARTVGWRAVALALRQLGMIGLAGVIALQLAAIAVDGRAWAALDRPARRAPITRYLLARYLREVTNQLLPMPQLAGLSTGALALVGPAGNLARAAGSIMADSVVEFLTQLIYIAAACGAFITLRPQTNFVIAIGPLLPLIVIVIAVGIWRCRRMPWFRRQLARLEARSPSVRALVDGSADVLRPRALPGAFAMHALGWLLGALQTWLALRLLGAHVAPERAIALDGLTAGARALAFFVPAGLGVQEVALFTLGAQLGIAPAAALALALVRRGRDFALAAPLPLVLLAARSSWRGIGAFAASQRASNGAAQWDRGAKRG